MDDETCHSLKEILDYLYTDEERHWMESNMPPAGHIFHDIIKVAEWLDAAQKCNHATNTKHPTTA